MKLVYKFSTIPIKQKINKKKQLKKKVKRKRKRIKTKSN
jgi:hypothetical protein